MLYHRLPMYIQRQEHALNSIEHSVAAWEFSRNSNTNSDNNNNNLHPLLWAFTGPTGVGKSETAFRVAETVLGRQRRVSYNRKILPAGLLVIRGEDYSLSSIISNTKSRSTFDGTAGNTGTSPTSSSTASTNGPTDTDSYSIGIIELRSLLAQRVILHLRNCGGNAVIILEEVQKIAPGILEVLVPGLENNGELRWKEMSVSTVNCIFIFISDIGSDVMVKLLLTHGGDRLSVPIGALRREVKLALNQQWDRLGLGKNIDEVVPFLPLERIHLYQILISKLRHLSIENQFVYWSELVVDSAVVDHLVSPEYIAYTQFSATTSSSSGSNNTADEHIDTILDGDNPTSIPPSTTTNSTGGNNSNGNNKRKVTKVFATWGARALENGGPLADLRGLLFRFMQPWRPRQILHVGLADTRTASSLFNAQNSNLDIPRSHTHARWTKSILPGQIYLQWCDPVIDMTTNSDGVDDVDEKGEGNKCDDISSGVKSESCKSHSRSSKGDEVSKSDNMYNTRTDERSIATEITTERAFSDACETIWFGSIVGS